MANTKSNRFIDSGCCNANSISTRDWHALFDLQFEDEKQKKVSFLPLRLQRRISRI